MKNILFILTLTFFSTAFAGCEKNYYVDDASVNTGNGVTGGGPNYILGDAYLTDFVQDLGSNRACMIDFDGDQLWELYSLMGCVNKDYQLIEVKFYNGISIETSAGALAVVRRADINNLRTAQGFGGKARILKLSMLKHDNYIGYGSYKNTGFGNCSFTFAGTATASQYEILSWSTVQ